MSDRKYDIPGNYRQKRRAFTSKNAGSRLIQGKLRMWGRWSYISGGTSGNMFNQLLVSSKITKTAINDALRRMKKSGITKPELEAYLREILNSKTKVVWRFARTMKA